MRTEENVLKRLDLELYVAIDTPNPVTAKESEERAQVLAWVLEKPTDWIIKRKEIVRAKMRREDTIRGNG